MRPWSFIPCGKDTSNRRSNPLGAMLKGFKNVEYLHTSGHATRQTIIDVCNISAPKIGIIPIHSEKPEILDGLALAYPIIHLNDGEIRCLGWVWGGCLWSDL